MSRKDLKTKVQAVLRSSLFSGPEDYITLSDGDAENVHLLIISPKLRTRRFRENRELIWKQLQTDLTEEEWGRISLVVAKTPEEVMAI